MTIALHYSKYDFLHLMSTKGIEGERKSTQSNKNDYCYDIRKSEMKRMSCRLLNKM